MTNDPAVPVSGQGIAASRLLGEVEEFTDEYLDAAETDARSPKVVHDGLWGTLRLEEAEVCLVDTPLLQRLRRVHQTGFAYLVYPSATHSRFEHSLGVVLQIQRLYDALQQQHPKGCPLDEAARRQMRLAGLLHDVGHGPFSHSTEQLYGPLLEPLREVLPSGAGSAKPHEMLSWAILQSARFKKLIAEIGSKFGIDVLPDELAGYVVGVDRVPPCYYKRELLNGPFDADKLDYLFRDSHFTGLPLSVDLDRLWQTTLIGEVARERRLVVSHTGSTPLEQVMFSKMVLFSTVYHHHKVRACDCMFAGIIEYMREHGIELPIGARKLGWTSPVDFLRVTDDAFASFGFAVKGGDGVLHDLIHNLFFRRLLKRALILSRSTIEVADDYQKLQRHAKNSTESLRVLRNLANRIWEESKKPCQKEEVWVDLPELPSAKTADETFVVPGPGSDLPATPLSKFMPMGPWVKQYGMHKWRGHVFCPPHCCGVVGAAAKTVLESTFGIKLKKEAFLWCKNRVP